MAYKITINKLKSYHILSLSPSFTFNATFLLDTQISIMEQFHTMMSEGNLSIVVSIHQKSSEHMGCSSNVFKA